MTPDAQAEPPRSGDKWVAFVRGPSLTGILPQKKSNRMAWKPIWETGCSYYDGYRMNGSWFVLRKKRGLTPLHDGRRRTFALQAANSYPR